MPSAIAFGESTGRRRRSRTRRARAALPNAAALGEKRWYHRPVPTRFGPLLGGHLGDALARSPLADADIRPALRTRLLSRHATEPETVILDELGVCRGQVRVDVAVVNGIVHGYEIKSDRDSLRRLAAQADLYGRVLDRATLVVGQRHLEEAFEVVPAWWGVLRVESTATGARLVRQRHGALNHMRDPRALVEFLWLEDALALLERQNAARGVRGKSRRFIWDRICERIEIDEIAAAVRSHLKARAGSPDPQSQL